MRAANPLTPGVGDSKARIRLWGKWKQREEGGGEQGRDAERSLGNEIPPEEFARKSGAAQWRGKPGPSCWRSLAPDGAHAGWSSAPSHGWAPLPISPTMSPNTREKPWAVRTVPALALGPWGVWHGDPVSSACPLPHCTPCCAPFWPASCFLSAHITFLHLCSWPKIYSFGVEAGFIFLQGLSCCRPESPLSDFAVDRLLTLHRHYIIPSKFKINPAVPEGLHDLCALTTLEIHLKNRQDPTDA